MVRSGTKTLPARRLPAKRKPAKRTPATKRTPANAALPADAGTEATLKGLTCRREFMDVRGPTKQDALERAARFVRQRPELRRYVPGNARNDRDALRRTCAALVFNMESCRLNLGIPLRDTIPRGRKQFVLGRVDTLVANGYGHAGPCLQVLNLNYAGGADELVWDIFVNDLFVACAAQSLYEFGQFPIRLVIDPLGGMGRSANGTSVRRTNLVEQRRLVHTASMARNKLGLMNYALADKNGSHPTVTVREICQLLGIFGMSLYKYVGPDWNGPYDLYFFSHVSAVPRAYKTRYVKIR